ncbi:MAG: hypothetical protein WCF18_21390, partial [Chthoniobacteraceae bacterium]
MNTDDPRFELIRRCLDGEATTEELAQLDARLREDANFRQAYVRYINLDVALSTVAKFVPMPATTMTPSRARRNVWLQWRPLTAAAAGLAIGLFSASVVFGFVVQRGVEKRTPLAVFEPGFENAQMPLANGFPAGPARWSGDAARVVAAENGVPPKEGKFMLRLEPMSKGVPRIYQVLDLHSVLSGAGGESQEIEVSASFATAGAESSVRYVIRAFAATEAPENLDAAWFDRRDESIASATKGLDVTPGVTGWQTV